MGLSWYDVQETFHNSQVPWLVIYAQYHFWNPGLEVGLEGLGYPIKVIKILVFPKIWENPQIHLFIGFLNQYFHHPFLGGFPSPIFGSTPISWRISLSDKAPRNVSWGSTLHMLHVRWLLAIFMDPLYPGTIHWNITKNIFHEGNITSLLSLPKDQSCFRVKGYL